MALFADAFGASVSRGHYRWKVIDSPWPVGAPTVWFADTGEQLVGQYAGTPMRFKLGDEVMTIMHICDVMTHPAYQRQGVLTEVGSIATETWREAGVPFVTGLHYGGWGSRRHYLGWQEQFKAIWMWRPLRLAPLLRQRNVHGALTVPLSVLGTVVNGLSYGAVLLASRAVRVQRIYQPDSRFDRLWERLQVHYEALAVRDRAWVDYRYAQAPAAEYRILLAERDGEPVGYLVYRLTREGERLTGWLVDLFTDPADRKSQLALLRAAMLQLFLAGAAAIRVFVGAGTPLVRLLRVLGFLRASGDYDVSIVPLREDMPHPALRDPNRWYALAGDFDVL
jgi:GNAT superfamily N-acetyltransferase